MENKSEIVSFIRLVQDQVCDALQEVDPEVNRQDDLWKRTDKSGGEGGGGETRIFRDGEVFEQGGVNFSEVHGSLPAVMAARLGHKGAEDVPFYATGVSLVIHPKSPQVPTVHANFRYLETEKVKWFGGGADLTPYVLDESDATHFHSVLQKSSDACGKLYYPEFKKECDEYFYIRHRKEARGIGGVFFDYLGKEDPENLNHYFDLTRSIGVSFCDAYFPIVKKNKDLPYTERQKEFQLLRRGRYVEFNLVYDRGTQFGLATDGRTESIMMSIPPHACWQYENDLSTNEEEAALIEVLRSPREWVEM